MTTSDLRWGDMDDMPLAECIRTRFAAARGRRGAWEEHWSDCYDHVLPQRSVGEETAGAKRHERLYDGTAPDAVEQLAASLLAQLTPPWSRWFSLVPGDEVPDEVRPDLGQALEGIADRLRAHLDRSNFAVEVHQCYLDLVVAGTGCLKFEETPPGSPSAFRFTAVPMWQAVLDEGTNGRLDTTFRRAELTRSNLIARYPNAVLPDDVAARADHDPDLKIAVIEAVVPDDAGYHFAAVLAEGDVDAPPLAEGRFATAPFIGFRWMKAPGEVYGRSPVMKALPDIKTVNKVVELILKNASIAVTGIWQADDDGVMNPANIKLVPGAIIPKAVGSAGLTPLGAPGKFDVGNLVLDQLRQRIRHALLADRLGQIDAPGMTATEVLERSAEMSRLLGATFGRLQTELLDPLIQRAVAILQRRGEIPSFAIDNRTVAITHQSPLARAQAKADVGGVTNWIAQLAALGPEGMATLDGAAAARWSAKMLGVPAELVRSAEASAAAMPPTAALGDQLTTMLGGDAASGLANAAVPDMPAPNLEGPGDVPV